jgi:hypothetical protein
VGAKMMKTKSERNFSLLNSRPAPCGLAFGDYFGILFFLHMDCTALIAL